jgi:DNA polymerase-1
MQNSKYQTAIVDGQNIFFKAFSVHKDFSVRVGDSSIFTGGTYGFVQSLLTLKRDYVEEDGTIIVAWDRGYKRRSEIYPAYKANRGDKSDWPDYSNFVEQRTMLQGVLRLLGIRQAFKDGEEADDIVGTLSRARRDNGKKVIIMSADKDFQQLLDKDIDLLAHKGKDNIRLWNEDSWEIEYGFHPSKFSLILGLMGDIGDNIPGVTGIGEKGAFKLVIENFQLLISILNHEYINALIPAKQSAAIRKLISEEGQYKFRLSHELALIDRHVKGIRIDKGNKDMEELEDRFEQLQFHSLLRDQNWEILRGI